MKSFLIEHNPISAFINEARHCVKARYPLVFMLMVPLIYPLFISLTYQNEQVTERNIALIDLDNSSASRELALNLDASQNLEIAAQNQSLTQAMHDLVSKKIDAIVWLPPELSTKIKKHESVSIPVYVNASNMLTYATTLSGIQNAILQTNTSLAIHNTKSLPSTTPQKARTTLDPIQISLQTLSIPSASYASFLIPVLFFLVFQQFTWICVGFSMAFRREQEIACNQPRKTYLFIDYCGFFLFDALFIALGALFVFMVLSPIFAWPTGAYQNLLPFLAAFVLAQFPLAICFAEGFNNRYAPFQILLFLAVPTFMLSGHVWPIQALPPTLQTLAHALAIHPASSAAHLIVYKNATPSELYPYYRDLLQLFVVYSVAAIIIIHRFHIINGIKHCLKLTRKRAIS